MIDTMQPHLEALATFQRVFESRFGITPRIIAVLRMNIPDLARNRQSLMDGCIEQIKAADPRLLVTSIRILKSWEFECIGDFPCRRVTVRHSWHKNRILRKIFFWQVVRVYHQECEQGDINWVFETQQAMTKEQYEAQLLEIPAMIKKHNLDHPDCRIDRVALYDRRFGAVAQRTWNELTEYDHSQREYQRLGPLPEFLHAGADT